MMKGFGEKKIVNLYTCGLRKKNQPKKNPEILFHNVLLSIPRASSSDGDRERPVRLDSQRAG
jgi:hypothetical protein